MEKIIISGLIGLGLGFWLKKSTAPASPGEKAPPTPDEIKAILVNMHRDQIEAMLGPGVHVTYDAKIKDPLYAQKEELKKLIVATFQPPAGTQIAVQAVNFSEDEINAFKEFIINQRAGIAISPATMAKVKTMAAKYKFAGVTK